MRILLDSMRRTHGRIIANDHTVILGWTDKTLFLLGELAEMMTDSQKGGGTIVVLGELDILEMRTEVKIAFPNWYQTWIEPPSHSPWAPSLLTARGSIICW